MEITSCVRHRNARFLVRVRFRSEKAYSQTLLPKRQRPSLAWWVVAIVIAIIAIGYFGFRNDAKRLVTAPWPLGFENLVLAGCADTGSMDGTKELHLLENQGAIFYDKSIKDGSGKYHTIDGTWMFDETAKRYAVTLDGVVTAYSIVAPERTGICMLIKGKHDAADLAAGWFALSTDNDPGDFQERERDTPGL